MEVKGGTGLGPVELKRKKKGVRGGLVGAGAIVVTPP